MGKKATKKLLKKFKGGGPGKQIKGAKGPKVKHGQAKKVGKAVSLATVLKNQKQRKRKRSEKHEIREQNSQEKPKATFDIESAGYKENGKKPNKSVKLENMSLDEFLAGGFKTVIDNDSESEEENGVSDLDSEVDEEVKEDGSDEGEKNPEREERNSEGDSAESDEDDVENHIQDLENLKESDPEFYKHLKENASELLDFGKNEKPESAKGKEKKEEKQKSQTKLEPGQKILTVKLLEKLCKEAFEKKSNEGLKKIVRAFGAGCHLADEEVDSKKRQNKTTDNTAKYVIYNPTVLQKLMVSTIRKTHFAFDNIIGVSKLKPGQLPKDSKKWKRQEKLIKRFTVDLLHLLNNSTDPSMLRFVLQNCKHYGKYFASFPETVARKYLKSLLHHFGSSEDEIVRIAAFLRVRQLAVEGPSGYVEKCMKGAYLAFVREAKYAKSELTAERIAIQAKCLVELFGVDLVVAYQLGFVYIRQLALHLRSALLSKSEESIKSVYCWQYIHCLKLWGVVLSTYPGVNFVETNDSKTVIAQHDQQLRPLIYPLVQVVIGTIQLVPASKYFPLRIHLLNVLNSISRTSKLYIPAAPLVLDILQTGELLDRKPIASTKKSPDLDFTLRLKKKDMLTGPCQQSLVTKTLMALENYFECHRLSVGFPEMIIPTLVTLRKFSRKTRVTRWRSEVQALISKLTKWSDIMKAKRAQAEFGPANVSRAAAFSTALERDEHERSLCQKAKSDAEINFNKLKTKPEDLNDDEDSVDSESEEKVAHNEVNHDNDDNDELPRKTKKQKTKRDFAVAGNDDIVEDLVELSSSEEDDE